eukprot:TRINITY_DN567_c1_g1_i2.p1 TRINITY_DN567_c1_g1~~TRINITY_DN567_c1_g1_i2.p1  ORF type:complete len:113 (+),score=19.47 TRINITY_DN567_c1_g1_i2:144-482(+)
MSSRGTPRGHQVEVGWTPSIQNIVSTASVDITVDLQEMAARLRNAEYSPHRFPAVIIRLQTPKATLLLFRSGKIVCTGTTSKKDSVIAFRRCHQLVEKCLRMSPYKINVFLN